MISLRSHACRLQGREMGGERGGSWWKHGKLLDGHLFNIELLHSAAFFPSGDGDNERAHV